MKFTDKTVAGVPVIEKENITNKTPTLAEPQAKMYDDVISGFIAQINKVKGQNLKQFSIVLIEQKKNTFLLGHLKQNHLKQLGNPIAVNMKRSCVTVQSRMKS